MSLTPDFDNLVIHSDASITDMVEFHKNLRDIEASELGILYPVIHTYKELPLGGSSIFPAVAFINGWTLQFTEGVFYISGGNLTATINPVPGCYVERMQSAASSVTIQTTSSGLSTEQNNKLMSLPSASETAAVAESAIVSALAPDMTRLLQMYILMGLDPTKPLIVTPSNRIAGEIVQTISTDSNTKITTVTRV